MSENSSDSDSDQAESPPPPPAPVPERTADSSSNSAGKGSSSFFQRLSGFPRKLFLKDHKKNKAVTDSSNVSKSTRPDSPPSVGPANTATVAEDGSSSGANSRGLKPMEQVKGFFTAGTSKPEGALTMRDPVRGEVWTDVWVTIDSSGIMKVLEGVGLLTGTAKYTFSLVNLDTVREMQCERDHCFMMLLTNANAAEIGSPARMSDGGIPAPSSLLTYVFQAKDRNDRDRWIALLQGMADGYKVRNVFKEGTSAVGNALSTATKATGQMFTQMTTTLLMNRGGDSSAASASEKSSKR